MMLRLLCSAFTAALVIAGPAHAQAAPTPMPAVPSHQCVKPEYPGRLASEKRIATFNRENSAYLDCMKKYIEDTKALANSAVAAGNAAVDEYNKFAAEIKAQNEANEAK